jgi:hypothetical protein
MALINCSECSTQVSDKAPACLHCGNPIATKGADVGVVTTEKTSKKFKQQKIVGWIMILTGIVVSMQVPKGEYVMFVLASGMTTIGMMVVLASKISSWWHHG